MKEPEIYSMMISRSDIGERQDRSHPFPFTDLTATKLRPALVLFEGQKDVVAAFISSRVPRRSTPTEIRINETHPKFKLTGLKSSSVIKFDKVATISKDLILGEIGEIGDKLKKETNTKLSKTYKFPT